MAAGQCTRGPRASSALPGRGELRQASPTRGKGRLAHPRHREGLRGDGREQPQTLADLPGARGQAGQRCPGSEAVHAARPGQEPGWGGRLPTQHEHSTGKTEEGGAGRLADCGH